MYTSRRFITPLFCAALTTPVERFETFVDGLKQQWIMEEITDEYAITKKMVKMAKNMMANKEWKTNLTKNKKVVALVA